jgi:hypothetical protein
MHKGGRKVVPVLAEESRQANQMEMSVQLDFPAEWEVGYDPEPALPGIEPCSRQERVTLLAYLK